MPVREAVGGRPVPLAQCARQPDAADGCAAVDTAPGVGLAAGPRRAWNPRPRPGRLLRDGSKSARILCRPMEANMV